MPRESGTILSKLGADIVKLIMSGSLGVSLLQIVTLKSYERMSSRGKWPWQVAGPGVIPSPKRRPSAYFVGLATLMYAS